MIGSRADLGAMADMQLPPSEADLHDQVIRLTQEKRELAEYADRVTKELRRYQQARPVPPARPEDDLPLPPWATNMQMMSPLLFSYEERIAELEAVIERSVSLAEQAQVLTKENDTLRAELHERTEQLRNAMVVQPVRDVGSATAAPDAQDDVQEMYRLSVEQCEALAQQNQLLKLQIERMQQSLASGQQQLREVQSRAVEGSRAFAAEQDRAAKAVGSERERWAEALSTERERATGELQRAEALQRQRGAAEQRLEVVTGELVEEVRTREQLEAQVQSLRHELQLQKQSLEMYRKSMGDRCNIENDEQERLRTDLERVVRSEKEHRQRISELERELLDVNETCSIVRREGDSAKQEAERMLPLMLSMDKRLKDVTERHDNLHTKLIDEENQVTDLQMEKDYWTTTEQGLKRQTERLEMRFQSEAEALRLRTPNHEVEGIRASFKKSVTDLEDRLRKSEQSVSDLQTQVELSEKQRAWEAAALERFSSVHSSERERLKSDLEEAQQLRLRQERQVDSMQQEVRKIQSEMDSANSESRDLLGKVNAELASAQTRCHGLERQLSHTKDEVRTAESLVTSSAGERSRLMDELKEERVRANEALDGDQRRWQAERRALERQLQSLQVKAQQDEQRACDLLKAQEALRFRWQAELGHEKDAMEAQVERLSQENRAMREKSRSLIKAVAMRRAAGDDVRLLPGGAARLPGAA